jgi:hypothetical protein
VAGAYCVYDDATGKVQYCYPEAYTIVGGSASPECLQYDTYSSSIPASPTPAPTMGPTPIQYASDHLKALFLIARFFTCFALAVIGWDYYKRRQVATGAVVGGPQEAYRPFDDL